MNFGNVGKFLIFEIEKDKDRRLLDGRTTLDAIWERVVDGIRRRQVGGLLLQ